MASVKSLGFHEPSALHYLITEGLFPEDAPRSSYKWSECLTRDEHGTLVTEEILHTSYCAVWSRNGAIKRLFNLDIEGEPILHAFITTFTNTSGGSYDSDEPCEESATAKPRSEPSLVIILKTQAHIFLLSGDTHVVPLSFDVARAFPSARGFILQSTGPHGSLSISQGNGKAHFAKESASTINPRTFCYTHLLSETGIVVASPTRRDQALDDCPALSPAEELLYVSKNDESSDTDPTDRMKSVSVAVTINNSKQEFTVWHVLFRPSEEEILSGKSRATTKKASKYRRQSSNAHERRDLTGTGSTRVPSTFRESFGAFERTFLDQEAKQEDVRNSKLETFAQQLGYEFEQSGVQTRSARRVSSMLARTDLGGANERSVFNDLAAAPASRKSLSRNVRREGSVGSFSDRQSFGVRRRSSFPVASSILSTNTSFIGVPGRVSLSEAHPDSTNDTSVISSTLSKDVGFLKLKTLPLDASSNTADPDAFDVLTLLSPESPTTEDKQSRVLSVCLLERSVEKITIVNVALKTPPQAKHATQAEMHSYELKVVGVQNGNSIANACVVRDGSVQRLLIHSRTTQGQSIFHLEAPWSPSYRIDFPQEYAVHHPYKAPTSSTRDRRQETGLHRRIPGEKVQLARFISSKSNNKFAFTDQRGDAHMLKIMLLPQDNLVRKILDLGHFILPNKQRDSLLIAYWEVHRWLHVQGQSDDIAWTSLVVTLFLMAVPFIGSLQDKPAFVQRRKKGGLLRSSSGTSVDLGNWEQMHEVKHISNPQKWLSRSPWDWSARDDGTSLQTRSPSKHSRTSSTDAADSSKKNTFLIRCTNLARDFLQSPAGENISGPEGYLPTAMGRGRDIRRISLARIVVGMHLLREDEKLSCLNLESGNQVDQKLAVCIAQLGSWLRWRNWTMSPNTYYGSEVIDHRDWLIEPSHITDLETPDEPFEPPSIFQNIEVAILSQPPNFPSLLDLVHRPRNKSSDLKLQKEAARLTPRLSAVLSFVQSYDKAGNARDMIELMGKAGLDLGMMATLPDGVLAACQKAVTSLRFDASRYRKDDLAHVKKGPEKRKGNSKTHNLQYSVHGTHDSLRDHRALGISALESESLSRWDMSSEMDRHTITRLIFGQDRRFQEASKLVNQTRPPEVEFVPETGSNESNLLEAQKQLAQFVTRRTLAVATGRGIMHYNARHPLLTERVPIPAFSLQCVMKPSSRVEGTQAMTFSADKALFTEDKVCWAFFHNGASAGLMISRDAKWIDTSWILYNKPAELTNRHAGFLLALGLNGHLRSLAKWVAFKYLTTKHTMTSVGLLLGLAASYLGTADTSITRLLSVHVPCLLPPGAPELNLSPPTQATGVMSIGLLFCGLQHRGMSEVMLAEVESRDSEEQSGDEPILRDEGYRLAAGISLGLINLAQGLRLHALHDMHLVERLLSIAVGTKNVNLVHVLDRATAGAVIAIAFIFMKTNDAAIARKIDIPDTTHQFDYVRPDVFLLRTLAKHLIMWDNIVPEIGFLQRNLPTEFRHRADLKTTKKLSTNDLPFFNVLAGMCFAMALRFAGSQRVDARNLLLAYLDQFSRLSRLPALNYDSRVTLNSVRNCLDVLALSAATVMAGSGDLEVMRRLRSLHGRTDRDTPFGSHLAAHMAIGALFLSGGTATFGTTNLAVASLVIAFYPLFPTDVLDNRGHLQALRHLWVLAVEPRCLVTRDVDTHQVIGGIVAQLHMVDGSKQELRTPGLLPELETIKLIEINTDGYDKAQLNLDEQDEHSKLRSRDQHKDSGKGVVLHLRRVALYDKPEVNIFAAELQALDEGRGIPSVDANAAVNERWKHGHVISDVVDAQKANPVEWVFDLPAFQHLDYAERALVLGTNTNQVNMKKGVQSLDGTVVDTKLEFELGVIGIEQDDGLDTGWRNGQDSKVISRDLPRDKLWQLRLLLAWADSWEQQEERQIREADEDGATSSSTRSGNSWLRQEVIDRLRWRVWNMSSSSNNDTL